MNLPPRGRARSHIRVRRIASSSGAETRSERSLLGLGLWGMDSGRSRDDLGAISGRRAARRLLDKHQGATARLVLLCKESHDVVDEETPVNHRRLDVQHDARSLAQVPLALEIVAAYGNRHPGSTAPGASVGLRRARWLCTVAGSMCRSPRCEDDRKEHREDRDDPSRHRQRSNVPVCTRYGGQAQ